MRSAFLKQPNSRPEVDRKVCDDDLSRICWLEKLPNQGVE